MISTALRVHECCGDCRRPIARCGCDSSSRSTYHGALLRGEWRELSRREMQSEDEEHEMALAA